MAAWAPKRFWADATVEQVSGGYAVRLDDRAVRTPAKRPLTLPTRAMAEAVAAEWQAQTAVVRPETMPVTRAANSALDKIAPQFAEVAGLIAAYGGTDLLCYRSTGPQALIDRQAAGWDPLLEWAAVAFDAPLTVTYGVMPVDQPEGSLRRLAAEVHRLSPFELAGFHDLVAISGSLVVGLAVARGHLAPARAWEIARIDEEWQAEVWGRDDEAAENEALRREAFFQAERFLALCG